MKKEIIIISLILVHCLAYADHQYDESHKSSVIEPIEKTEQYEVYGDSWPVHNGTTINLSTAITALNNEQAESAVYTGEVTQVCQKMGCWMILTDEEKFARVAFNQHAFFIPKESRGKAQVYGQLYEKELTEEQRAHFESEGSGPLPDKIYEITAFSVKLFK